MRYLVTYSRRLASGGRIIAIEQDMNESDFAIVASGENNNKFGYIVIKAKLIQPDFTILNSHWHDESIDYQKIIE